ncbi:unnamed protein product [Ectocarpus sp. 4 AP-2014]
MWLRAGPVLLGFCSMPTVSFVLPPTPILARVNRRARATDTADFRVPVVNGGGHGGSTGPGAKPLQRRYSRIAPTSCRCCCNFCRGMSHAFGGAPTSGATIGMRLASREGNHVSANTPSEAIPAFASNDGVSYLRNPDTGSEIWLVGVVHGQETSVELSKSVVRTTRPQVVMLELDSSRLDDLPPGEAQKAEDGLTWFMPEKPPDNAVAQGVTLEGGGDDVELSRGRKWEGPFAFMSSSRATSFVGAMRAIIDVFEEQEVSEMEVAVLEAQACGARILLGDRDFEETKGRLVAAGLADTVGDERLDDPEALLNDSMSVSNRKKFAGLDLRKPETREAAGEHYAAMKRLSNQRALEAMVPERDEVMARNLMTLKGKPITVALVGLFHVDGIERILKRNGWNHGPA